MWTTKEAIGRYFKKNNYYFGAPGIGFVLKKPVEIREVNGVTAEWIELPDSYLIEVKDGRLTCGKEEGIYYFSPSGFDAMFEELRAIFVGNDQEWEEFCTAVDGFYRELEAKTRRYKEQLENKANELGDKIMDKINH